MTQTQMWELFWKSRNTITEHIKNIYSEQELEKDITIKKIVNVGKTDNSFVKPTNYYNLEVILAVWYRFYKYLMKILNPSNLNGFKKSLI